jgi:uncharacterized protein YrrD
MRKGKTIIGKDVLSLAQGVRVHTVKDLIIGEGNDEIVALLVDEGGLLNSSTVVPIEAVHSFGKDAVVIADASAVVAASSYPRVNAILNRKESLLGKKVFTHTGEQLGAISDMYFEEASGRISGLEVSGGKLGDLASGTSYLPIEEIQRSGPDVVFVDPSAAEALEGQVGGLQGALRDAQERAGQVAGDTRDKVGQAAGDARTKLEQDPETALVGRRSGMDVMDENGSVVVANGQRITADHVARAKESGNLEVLTQAASLGQREETGEQVGAAVQGLGDSASSLWDRFTAKLGEVTDAQGKKVDEQQTKQKLSQISDAIGRPVTKVILDRNDDVILDLGDIITHQAVQQAYDAGMLDTLLDSVYKGDVTFTRDEMMARQEGAATVQKASGGAMLVEELQQKVETAEQERQAESEEKRQQAEAERTRREEERQQRAQEREQADLQRMQEIQEATATRGPAASGGVSGDEQRGATSVSAPSS